MNKYRKQIEQEKQKLRKQIASNSTAFKNSIVRKIILINKGSSSTQDVINNITYTFRLSNRDKALINAKLQSTQAKIASIHSDYFDSLPSTITAFDYERMLAAYDVDFAGIEETIRAKVKREFTSAISGDYGIEVIRKKLINSGLGFAQAYTEANTALAQFDNSYHTELAQQAGIDRFLWDGSTLAIRQYCKDRVGNIYTLAELEQMDNGQGLPVVTSCGGYNCVHFLTAVIN